MRVCAKEAYETIDELLIERQISEVQADSYLANLACVTLDSALAERVVDDATRAEALAGIASVTGEADVAEAAFEAVELILDPEKRDQALMKTVVALGDMEAATLIGNPVLRNKALADIVIRRRDQSLLCHLPAHCRIEVVEVMVHVTNDLSWFDGIEDVDTRDDRLALFALGTNNKAAVDCIENPYRRAQALMDMRYRERQLFDLNEKPVVILEEEIRSTIARIEDPMVRGDLYVAFMQASGDRSVLGELERAASELEGSDAVRALSFVARFSEDAELARSVQARISEISPADKELVLANIAAALRDISILGKIRDNDKGLYERTQTDILLAIGDRHLAMRWGNRRAASELAVEAEDVELAWKIGSRWSNNGRNYTAYAPVLDIAIKQKSIEPLLLRRRERNVVRHLVRRYVEETGDALEVELLCDPYLTQAITPIMAVKFVDKELAEKTKDPSTIDAVKKRLEAVVPLLEEEVAGGDKSLQGIAGITDPVTRLRRYEAYLHTHRLPPEFMEDIAARIIVTARQHLPDGSRHGVLQRIAERVGSLPLMREAAYDALYITDKGTRVHNIVCALRSLQQQVAHARQISDTNV